MNSGVVRLDQRMSILQTSNNHRLQSLLLCYVLHILNLNYKIIDQRKLLKVFRSVLCEIQRNQSNLLTSKN